MHIAHIARTEYNVLILDDAGFCVRIESRNGREAPASDGILRCIGAQFVASIDPSAPGGLAHWPRVGTSMLFAAVDANGRIFCLRVGPLTHFESSDGDAGDSGVHEAPIGGERRASFVVDNATEPFVRPRVDDDLSPDDETLRSDRPRSVSSYPPPPPRLPRVRPPTASRPSGWPPSPRSDAWLIKTPIVTGQRKLA